MRILGMILAITLISLAAGQSSDYWAGYNDGLYHGMSEGLLSGKIIGQMDTVKSAALAFGGQQGIDTYNSMVDKANQMVSLHNEIVRNAFKGNTTRMEELILKPFSYI